MAVYELTLENLPKLDDGKIAVAFNQAVRRIISDCQDRPGEEKPRKLTLQVDAVPIVEEGGDAYNAKFVFQIKETLPTRKSKVFEGAMRKGGRLAFNDLADDNADQRTFDDGHAASE